MGSWQDEWQDVGERTADERWQEPGGKERETVNELL